MTSTLEKDEIVFCINCVQTNYPGIWSDTPLKVKELLFDVYEEDVDIKIVEGLFNERIIEEDEYLLLYGNYGYK